MEGKNALRGLPVYQPGKSLEEVKQEFGLSEVVKLASNENPFGCSPRVWEALREEQSHTPLYPEAEAPQLRGELARSLGVDPERLVFGNGSDEIVQMIARAYLDQGDEAVMAEVTFPRYKTQTVIEGGVPVEVPLKDGVHDLEAMAAAVTERTRLIWVCNPNNPTGTIVSGKELEAFLERLPEHVLVVVDEAYFEYVEDPSYPDSLALLKKDPRLLVLRTFSKIYGLAAFRIGYGVTSEAIVGELNKVREPFNTNRIAQRAARAALTDQEFVQRCQKANREGIEQIQRQLVEWGLSAFPTQGNFLLIDTGRPADEVYQSLLKQGIIIRSGAALGYPTHIRVTIGNEEQNRLFLQGLAACLEKPFTERG
ncbi:histidinol-phosphate transaminase [Kroppenstedtia eburnea]|uniref:Histidinol-phosphate aminotransferase n=1 Tax=Kroppenstedtia eburnea TaxID=714067 RepID=A0A1N7IQ10_9BACL|nr:histidinol-phosphate transaminase [Kroppenstedtia eburnea]QKI82070.1 histidinol-phosphate transaminase [Kroppenstedtia eburnea]SIS39184.1 histidinol-phosphate aminotransferase [Kroppenstedtia eburnea]